MNTTRKYPRTLNSADGAFKDCEYAASVIQTRPTVWQRIVRRIAEWLHLH